MIVIPTAGRAALAAALAAQAIHVAWGTGEAWWDTDRSETLTFAGIPQQVTTDRAPISAVVVTSLDGETIYQIDADYVVSGQLGQITRVATGAIPSGGAVRVAYHAGRPDPSPDVTALEAEIGRRAATTVAFVSLDDAGDITLPNGTRWTISETPTSHLYVAVRFEFADAPSSIIREAAIFLGTEPEASVPPGQMYLTPPEVADPGILLLVERTTPIIRDGATRQSLSYVVSL